MCILFYFIWPSISGTSRFVCELTKITQRVRQKDRRGHTLTRRRKTTSWCLAGVKIVKCSSDERGAKCRRYLSNHYLLLQASQWLNDQFSEVSLITGSLCGPGWLRSILITWYCHPIIRSVFPLRLRCVPTLYLPDKFQFV